REVERVVQVVALGVEVLVAEGPRAALRRCRRAAHGGPEEGVAALVGDLFAGRVLPAVQQRVGDRVLLLDADLVDDQVGQAGVETAVGVAFARRLVGLLVVRLRETQFFGFALFAFFRWALRGEFF